MGAVAPVAYIAGFGAYLPQQLVSNAEIGAMVGCDAGWIREVSGIETRRWAGDGESVPDMGAKAALVCLDRAGVKASELGMILVSSGSSGWQFPGPAASVARLLGLDTTPAVDIPHASAGTLFGMSLASRLAGSVGNILVVGSERMSGIVTRQPMDRNVAVLFGDGAGACLIRPDRGMARVIDSALYSDGAFAEDLKLEFGLPLAMNGRSVILQATRKIPRAVAALFDKHNRPVEDAQVFLMHQANQNLIAKIAAALSVEPGKFYSNISRYGNTSSASMLIAADEWSRGEGFVKGSLACFAAFGAGFHWGALLAEGV